MRVPHLQIGFCPLPCYKPRPPLLQRRCVIRERALIVVQSAMGIPATVVGVGYIPIQAQCLRIIVDRFSVFTQAIVCKSTFNVGFRIFRTDFNRTGKGGDPATVITVCLGSEELCPFDNKLTRLGILPFQAIPTHESGGDEDAGNKHRHHNVD